MRIIRQECKKRGRAVVRGFRGLWELGIQGSRFRRRSLIDAGEDARATDGMRRLVSRSS